MLYKTLNAFREAKLDWPWKNFSAEELACKCRKHCSGEYFHDPDFLDKLQALRDLSKKPLRINSGHRCERHNRAVGGAKNSRHLLIAADISITGMTLEERRSLYARAVKVGFTGIGRAKTFLHVDNRPNPAEWFYSDSKSHW